VARSTAAVRPWHAGHVRVDCAGDGGQQHSLIATSIAPEVPFRVNPGPCRLRQDPAWRPAKPLVARHAILDMTRESPFRVTLA
jgi:hypothetical protein